MIMEWGYNIITMTGHIWVCWFLTTPQTKKIMKRPAKAGPRNGAAPLRKVTAVTIPRRLCQCGAMSRHYEAFTQTPGSSKRLICELSSKQCSNHADLGELVGIRTDSLIYPLPQISAFHGRPFKGDNFFASSPPIRLRNKLSRDNWGTPQPEACASNLQRKCWLKPEW